MLERLKILREQTLRELEQITDAEALRRLHSATVGKKGEITAIKRTIGSLSPDERPAAGKLANEVAQELEARFAKREKLIKEQTLARDLEEGAIDVTLPGHTVLMGRLHPATETLRQAYDIWAGMGFQVYRSRDVEDDDTNFTPFSLRA